MSQESYDTIQQVSQPTTAPKNMIQVRNDEWDAGAYTCTPWRHVAISPAGLLGSLYGVRASKLSHWTTFLKSTLGQAPLRQPCFSRLVSDAGATLKGTVCSRRGSLAHGRSRSAGLSVSIDRSFGNFGVLSAQAQLAPLRTS